MDLKSIANLFFATFALGALGACAGIRHVERAPLAEPATIETRQAHPLDHPPTRVEMLVQLLNRR